MWIIELNVAGYRFTREMPDLPRKQARLRPATCIGRYCATRTDIPPPHDTAQHIDAEAWRHPREDVDQRRSGDARAGRGRGHH
ncbi:hypothetical protein I551_1869 [Mycobacterium ulcerans str. Harvey]|uniref:Uncharacterized protein n=1 Tax=Mycobacterium ulcerans str. Harvey TaxID=1299332 RepID=A0ABN0R3R2_MYCUL|nr:hypothetical protein I551_1869 [Mycobacterium ulcerans str. Harvey]